jgi:hypothetical protein
MEDIPESSPEFKPIDVVENGELEARYSVNENGLETIDEQTFRDGSSASGMANGSTNGEEKPELSNVLEMVCI